jgi:hypothetical protein
VPAQDAADRLGVRRLDRGDVQPELEARAAPGNPHHPVTEALLGERLAVSCCSQRDPAVGVQVVDVWRLHQRVHGRVDARCRSAPPVQAVVEGGDHLVLALDTGVDVDQRAQPVEAQHGQPALLQGAEVTAGPLDPQQLDRLGGDRVLGDALRRGVAAGVVGVARVRAQSVGPGDQVGDDLVSKRPPGCRHHAHPACVPPTRSASMRSW